VTRLENMLGVLSTDGFSPLQQAYTDNWLHAGQRVELEEGYGQSQLAERISLTIDGLTPHGFLRASDAAGHSYELHPDGNSLDFFKGLIRRKLPAT
jgi:biotin--protein ligase